MEGSREIVSGVALASLSSVIVISEGETWVKKSEYDQLYQKKLELEIELSKLSTEHIRVLKMPSSKDEEITVLRDANTGYQKKITELEANISDLNRQMDRLTQMMNGSCFVDAIGGRQYAVSVEYKAMEYVFPNCRQKPYCLRSFKNVLSFIEHPRAGEIAPDTAPAAWEVMDVNLKGLIKRRARFVIDSFSNLVWGLKVLKEDGNNVAHIPRSTAELRSYFDSLTDQTDRAIKLEALESLESFERVQLPPDPQITLSVFLIGSIEASASSTPGADEVN